jgi:hypothetical protein
VSIYFLGYLFRTSAATWHKITWPKTSKCKYTNTRATLKVLKNAISSRTHIDCLFRPSPSICIVCLYVSSLLVCPYTPYIPNTPISLYCTCISILLLVYSYIPLIIIVCPLYISLFALYPFLHLYLHLICIEE